MKLGFIGTGKIASSVIAGICCSKISFTKILISPRNTKIANTLKTKFTGSATSSYPTSHSLDGTVVGFGVEKSSDNGMFFRLEYNDYSIDGKSIVNAGADSKFTATLNDVSGSTGRVSIGKAF